jgi:hypothetical protein
MKSNTFFHINLVIMVLLMPLLNSSQPAKCVEVLWTEDFESALTGSMETWDTAWEELESACASVIQSLESFNGQSYLEVWANSLTSSVPLTECIELYDDSFTASHSDWLELSWWMRCSPESNWKITVKACNGQEVCTFSNNELGSTGAIDVLTEQGWQETVATLSADVWTELALQLDFGANPVKYRLCVGDSASWYGWYTLGIDAECLGLINIFNDGSRTCYDDFCLCIVPEPATIGMLALGALVLLRKRKT